MAVDRAGRKFTAADALRICDGAACVRRARKDQPEGNWNLCDQGRGKSSTRRTRAGKGRERNTRARTPDRTTSRDQLGGNRNHAERRRGPWWHALERCCSGSGRRDRCSLFDGGGVVGDRANTIESQAGRRTNEGVCVGRYKQAANGTNAGGR